MASVKASGMISMIGSATWLSGAMAFKKLRGKAGESVTCVCCCVLSIVSAGSGTCGGGGGGGGGGVAILVGETMAAVSAMLCEEDVNAAVQGEACRFSESSRGFTCGNKDCAAGKAAPNAGGKRAVPGDGYGNGAAQD